MILSVDIDHTYNWYEQKVDTIPHLRRRELDQFKEFAEKGQLITAKNVRDEVVGSVYFCPNGESWEIGGLIVDETKRVERIGSNLINFALSKLVIDRQPNSIISHVHANNSKPVNLLERLKFVKTRAIKLDPSSANFNGLEVSPDGFIHGFEYAMNFKDGIDSLANWCRASHVSSPNFQYDLIEGETMMHWARSLDKFVRI